MSIEGKAKEAAGYINEEVNEHGKSPDPDTRCFDPHRFGVTR